MENIRHKPPTHTLGRFQMPHPPFPCLSASQNWLFPSPGLCPSYWHLCPLVTLPGLSSTPGALPVGGTFSAALSPSSPLTLCPAIASLCCHLHQDSFLQVGLLSIRQCAAQAALKRYLLNDGNLEAGKEEVTGKWGMGWGQGMSLKPVEMQANLHKTDLV